MTLLVKTTKSDLYFVFLIELEEECNHFNKASVLARGSISTRNLILNIPNLYERAE